MRPNVLLIVLDSVRAANTSLHGYHRETTPFLSEFSKEATVYREARTNGRWSVPAHASLFTGYAASEHGLYSPTSKLKPEQTIFHELGEAGYRTGLFSSNSFVTGEIDTGLHLDFEKVVGDLEPFFPEGIDPLNYNGGVGSFLRDAMCHKHPVQSVINGILTKLGWDYPYIIPTSLTAGTSASRPLDSYYINQFEQWKENGTGPWAACVNLMDAHVPYLPASNPWASFRAKQRHLQWGLDWEILSKERFDLLPEFTDLYDGAIQQTDSHLQRIITNLKRSGEFEDTLIVIAGDHGEGFGEQSPIRGIPVIQHLYGFHECILHVPLITKHPGQTESETIDELAALQGFPQLVRDTVFENQQTDMRKSEIYVSGHLTDNNIQSWQQHTDSDPRFRGHVQLKYEQNEHNQIVKYIGWKSRAIEMNGQKVRPISREELERDFDSLSDMEMILSNDEQEISESTTRKLEDLGYL